jgi:flagellar biosynthesis protein
MAKRVASAVRYDRRLPAPFVVASGSGRRAEQLLSLAQEYGVPVQNAPELAERLIELDPGTVIPEELFQPVAEILAFVLALEESGEDSSRRHEKNSSQ